MVVHRPAANDQFIGDLPVRPSRGDVSLQEPQEPLDSNERAFQIVGDGVGKVFHLIASGLEQSDETLPLRRFITLQFEQQASALFVSVLAVHQLSEADEI